jgi:hypothetical protein
MARTLDPEYIPGVCNIDKREVGRRTNLAIAGVVIFCVLTVILYYYSLDVNWRLLLFIPAFMIAYGYLQARMQFCVSYGFRGESKFAGKRVKRSEHVETDRKRAVRILVYALIIAGFVTATAYYVPI